MPKNDDKRTILLLKLEELFTESISTRLLMNPRLWDKHTFSQKTIDKLIIYTDEYNCKYINHPFTRTKLYIEFITNLPENSIINDFILIFWYCKTNVQFDYQTLKKFLQYFLQYLLINQKNNNQTNHLYYNSEIQDLLLKELATLLEYSNEIITILSSEKKTLDQIYNKYKPSESNLNGILFIAVKQNNTRLANLLLSKKFKINTHFIDHKGKTLLFWACYYGDIEMAKTLIIDYKANVNIQENKNYTTPLFWACYNGQLELVELLLEYGAIINSLDINGQTALFWACKYGQYKIVETLIVNNAKIDLKDFKGQTPFEIAYSKNNRKLAELLTEYSKSIRKKYRNLLWKYNKNTTRLSHYHDDPLMEFNYLLKNSRARVNRKYKLNI